MADPYFGLTDPHSDVPPDIANDPLYKNPNAIIRNRRQYAPIPYEELYARHGSDDAVQAFDSVEGLGAGEKFYKQIRENADKWQQPFEGLLKGTGMAVNAATGAKDAAIDAVSGVVKKPIVSMANTILDTWNLPIRMLMAYGATLNDPDTPPSKEVLPGLPFSPRIPEKMNMGTLEQTKNIFMKHWDDPDVKELRFRNTMGGNFIGRNMYALNELAKDFTQYGKSINYFAQPYSDVAEGAKKVWQTTAKLRGMKIPNEEITGLADTPHYWIDKDGNRTRQSFRYYNQPLLERYRELVGSRQAGDWVEQNGGMLIDLPAVAVASILDPTFLIGSIGLHEYRMMKNMNFLKTISPDKEQGINQLLFKVYGDPMSKAHAADIHEAIWGKTFKSIGGRPVGMGQDPVGLQEMAKLMTVTNKSPIPWWGQTQFAKNTRSFRHRVPAGVGDAVADFENVRHEANMDFDEIVKSAPELSKKMEGWTNEERVLFDTVLGHDPSMARYYGIVADGKAPMLPPKIHEALEEWAKISPMNYRHRDNWWMTPGGVTMREKRINKMLNEKVWPNFTGNPEARAPFAHIDIHNTRFEELEAHIMVPSAPAQILPTAKSVPIPPTNFTFGTIFKKLNAKQVKRYSDAELVELVANAQKTSGKQLNSSQLLHKVGDKFEVVDMKKFDDVVSQVKDYLNLLRAKPVGEAMAGPSKFKSIMTRDDIHKYLSMPAKERPEVKIYHKTAKAYIPMKQEFASPILADMSSHPAFRKIYSKRINVDPPEMRRGPIDPARKRSYLLSRSDDESYDEYLKNLTGAAERDPELIRSENERIISGMMEQARLEKYDFSRVQLTDKLKQMAKDINDFGGLSPAETENAKKMIDEFVSFLGDSKEVPADIRSMTAQTIDDITKDAKRFWLFSPMTFPRYLTGNVTENYGKYFMDANMDDLLRKYKPYGLDGVKLNFVKRDIPRDATTYTDELGRKIKTGFYQAPREGKLAFLGKYSDWIDKVNNLAEDARQLVGMQQYHKKAEELMKMGGMSIQSIHKSAKRFADTAVQDQQFFHESLPVALSWAERVIPFFGTYMWPTFRWNLHALATRPVRSRLVGMMARELNDYGQIGQDGDIRLKYDDGGEHRISPGFGMPLYRFFNDAAREPSPSSYGDDKASKAIGLLNALSFGMRESSRFDPRKTEDTLPSFLKTGWDTTDYVYNRMKHIKPDYEDEHNARKITKDIARMLSPVELFTRIYAGQSVDDAVNALLIDNRSRASTMLERLATFHIREAAMQGREITMEESRKESRYLIATQALWNMIPGSSKIISSPEAKQLIEFQKLYKAMPDADSRALMKQNFRPDITLRDGRRIGDDIVPSEIYVSPDEPNAEFLTSLYDLIQTGDKMGVVNRYKTGTNIQKLQATRRFGDKLKQFLSPDDVQDYMLSHPSDDMGWSYGGR